VVDDSILRGDALAAARRDIRLSPHQNDIVSFCAVYAHPSQRERVDLWLECLENRVFEWNIMDHYLLSHSCVDIDGVLCRDPTEGENDDGPEYLHFIATVPALYRPSQPIGWLVTSRLSKFREPTERWLAAQGIRYQRLVMLDLPRREDRVARGCHARYKADVYRSVAARLFIESSVRQAQEIAVLARKPVFCMESRVMHYHLPVRRLRSRDAVERTVRKVAGSVTPRIVKDQVRRRLVD
jgi:orotate phosphoribosyltransferase